MKLAPLFACAFSCLAVACSSGSSGSLGSSSGSSGTASFSGTVGGKAFTFQSGLAYVKNSKRVDLIFSDYAGICESTQKVHLHAGETLLQAYGLEGTAPGKFTPADNDVKYASIAASCASGQAIEGSVDKHSDVSAADVTLSSVSSTTVEGDITLTFKDGSNVSGHFAVPVCSVDNDLEHATCY